VIERERERERERMGKRCSPVRRCRERERGRGWVVRRNNIWVKLSVVALCELVSIL